MTKGIVVEERIGMAFFVKIDYEWNSADSSHLHVVDSRVLCHHGHPCFSNEKI